MAPQEEGVNHPPHYQRGTGYEVIDVIHAWDLDFNLGNAVKYIARAGRKRGARTEVDLEKAVWYLNDALMRIRGDQLILSVGAPSSAHRLVLTAPFAAIAGGMFRTVVLEYPTPLGDRGAMERDWIKNVVRPRLAPGGEILRYRAPETVGL